MEEIISFDIDSVIRLLVLFIVYSGLVVVGIFVGKYIAQSKDRSQDKSKTQPLDISKIVTKVDGKTFVTITTMETKEDEEAK